MSNAKAHNLGWWLKLTLGIVALAFLLLLWLKPSAILPATVTLVIDTNGVAHLGPVPLSNTNVQDKVLLALGTLGIETKVAVHLPTNGAPMMPTKKLIETLDSIGRAGSFPKKQPPNPYE